MAADPDRREGPEARDTRPERQPEEPAPPEPEPDFAAEHTSLTFADQMPGGPEGAREPESPRGLAGMDPRCWVRPWRRWFRPRRRFRPWRRRRPRRG
jgi:hypothetical protein